MTVGAADTGGQPLENDGISNRWHWSRLDLTPWAGKTVSTILTGNNTSGGDGAWDMWFSDMVYAQAVDTVQPLYNRENNVTWATAVFSGTVTNLSAVSELVSDQSMANTTYYYHGDQIGSSRLMTSGGGWPVWQGTFLPYGEEYNAQIGTNHYKFTGKERDDESGLDYFGARYYANGLGRFLTPDPLLSSGHPDDPQRWNRFTYVRNNPLIRIDPTGCYDFKKCSKGDAQCQNHRDRFTRGVNMGRSLLATMDPKSKEAKALAKSLKALGFEGDKNGVTVSLGKTDTGGPADTIGLHI